MIFIVIASLIVLGFFYYSIQRRKVKLHNRRIDNQERFERLMEQVKKEKDTDNK